MDGSYGDQQTTTQVYRAPSLKRGRNEERTSERVKLEKVLGVTVASNAALACDVNTGTVAYPAGCTVVLFNTITEQQSHLINASRKSITCLSFSSCGRYLVTGECGHQPAVRVWDLQGDPASQHPGLTPQPQQVAEFFSHKYGVNCVAFSPTNKYVVSIGTQHDMIVNVWDWRSNVKVASNKVSTKVKAVAFAENGNHFVTVGNRLVKFWYLEYGKAKYKEAVPLMGRSAILGEQRNNYFCDVACGKGACEESTYAITRSGLLCEFNVRRLLDKWVELRTTSANCLVVGEHHIFVGCADGIIRCFDPRTLGFVTTLPRTHYLGVDVSEGTSIAHMACPPRDARYPDTVAVTYDERHQKLTSVYNDHSVYVWDVTNIKKVGKSFSFLYHSACIWGVEIPPAGSPFPAGSFLTCGSDDTVRVWMLEKRRKGGSGVYRTNIYSNELLKAVYVDKEMTYLKDLDQSTTTTDKQESSYDGRNGVRAIRISPDGNHLASGDRSGNIRIHETATMKEIVRVEAHDAEVLCLEYSGPESAHKLMASASRDRLIHVFDVNKNYELLQTLDDHSSSITAVRFLTSHKNLQMVSCGADKSLIFRTLTTTPNGTTQFTRRHNIGGKTTLYDMEVDAGQKHVLTACQDRQVRVYSISSGKHTKSMKGSAGADGTLIKVALDRSGIYLATSCTDKSLSIYDYYSDECMATMCGHSELATGLRFTNDCRRLISASGDGCIFIWRVPHDMTITMHARLSQQAMRLGRTLDTDDFSDTSTTTTTTHDDYHFNVTQLPLWAKKHITDDTSPPTSLHKPPAAAAVAPRGRWAQRAERSATVKSVYPDAVITLPSLQDVDGQVSGGGRRANLTDDSGLGSLKDLHESHDADIDSDNTDSRPVYYPSSHVDTGSGGEFTVTNMDAEELRRSQRRSRRAAPLALQQEFSDDEEDGASTPSGENTDRNPLSMLSGSLESLDQMVCREKYLQKTFESLDGEVVGGGGSGSISSQFLRLGSGSGGRNVSAINAVKQTRNDPEAIKKREELKRRIADTKKKLSNVGRSSPLKYSQSTHDLSYIPERDHSWTSSPTKPKPVHVAADNSDSNLHRSFSLSDLSPNNPAAAKSKIEQGSTKPKPAQSARLSHAPSSGQQPRYVKAGLTSLARSSSAGVLNHSDSDGEKPRKGALQGVGRLMRPTISSQNKTKANGKGLYNRKRQSYSTINLSTVGQNELSSSEDEGKPIVPPRSRANGEVVGVRRHHSVKEKAKASRNGQNYDRHKSVDLDTTLTNDSADSSESLDLTIVQSNTQLAADISATLSVFHDAVDLHRRLADTDPNGKESKLLELWLQRLHAKHCDSVADLLKQSPSTQHLQTSNFRQALAAFQKCLDVMEKTSIGGDT